MSTVFEKLFIVKTNLSRLENVDKYLYAEIVCLKDYIRSHYEKLNLINEFLRTWDKGHLFSLIHEMRRVRSLVLKEKYLETEEKKYYLKVLGHLDIIIRRFSIEQKISDDEERRKYKTQKEYFLMIREYLIEFKEDLTKLEELINKQLEFLEKTYDDLVLERRDMPILLDFVHKEAKILFGVEVKGVIGEKDTLLNLIREIKKIKGVEKELEKPYVYVGIDIGSTSVKIVVINDEEKVIGEIYEVPKAIIKVESLQDKGKICINNCSKCTAHICEKEKVKKIVGNFLKEYIDRYHVKAIVTTGSQTESPEFENFLISTFHVGHILHIPELYANRLGVQQISPECKAIMDVGGQDSKSMIQTGTGWVSQMSKMCGAGTGANLEVNAKSLYPHVKDPLKQFCKEASLDTKVRLSERCAVLMNTSLNAQKKLGFSNRDLAGAVINAMVQSVWANVGILFQNYSGPIAFTGGVSDLEKVKEALSKITTNNKIIVPEYNKEMGALGAAIQAKRLFDYNKMPKIEKKKSVTYERQTLPKIPVTNVVWRSLFFPPEILNAAGVEIWTIESFAASKSKDQEEVRKAFQNLLGIGEFKQKCSFQKVALGSYKEFPYPRLICYTTKPCGTTVDTLERLGELKMGRPESEKRYFPLAPITNYRYIEEIMETLIDLYKKLVLGFPSEKYLESRMKLDTLHRAINYGIPDKDFTRLQKAIRYSNETRECMIKINRLRNKNPRVLTGIQALNLASVLHEGWGSKKFYEQIKRLLSFCEKRSKKKLAPPKHRLLWLHLRPYHDPHLIREIIEKRFDSAIVMEEVNHIFWKELDVDNPFQSMAERLIYHPVMNKQRRLNMINGLIQEYNIDAGIIYAHGLENSYCPLTDEDFLNDLKKVFKKYDKPLLILAGDCVDATLQPSNIVAQLENLLGELSEMKTGYFDGLPRLEPKRQEEFKIKG